MDLFTEYSLWWAVPCLLLGLLYAWILYRKDETLEDAAPWLKKLLAALRTLVVTGIALLLLGPFFRYIERQIQKPIVLVAQDNSSSLLLGPDSADYRSAYKERMAALVASLEEDYEVQTYTFDKELGNDFEIDYTGSQTDIAKAMTELVERNVNRNIGALVLASDGIYNRGASPTYVADRAGVPVYTIAMGDTTIRRDLLIESVAHNRLAYLGNDFPIEVSVKADRFAGKTTSMVIKQGGTELMRKTIDISDDAFLITLPATLTAGQVGRQRFDIALSTLDDELSTSNNYRSIYIDVLDSRQKVLMLYDAPHPDIAAVRSAIEGNENYEVVLRKITAFKGKLDEYDLIILRGLPARNMSIDQTLVAARNAKVPVWVLGGLDMNWEQLNKSGFGVSVAPKGGANTTDASPGLDRDFSLFKLSEGIGQSISQWPPLKTDFADFNGEPSARVLMTQRIGVVDTDQPLWAFSEVDGHKTSITLGEGLWRWRIIDHVEHDNFDHFDELVSRTIQFLATKEDRRQFRVYGADRFDEDQRIILEAELYNQSYEMINTPEVSVTFSDQESNAFDFVFARNQSGYYLDAGRLPVGQYNYTATASFEGKTYSAAGSLIVAAIQVESVRTTADHQLLYSLASSTGGAMYYPTQLTELAQALRSTDDIVPMIYSSEQVTELIESRWIFFLFLLLLAIEWFVRKFKGGY